MHTIQQKKVVSEFHNYDTGRAMANKTVNVQQFGALAQPYIRAF